MTVLPPTPISSLLGTSPITGPSTPGNSLGKDAFLKLLVAQLKYQDPTAPTDSAQFMAQTAQFTQVEKLEEIAAAVAQSLGAQSLLSAAALVGRTVTWHAPDGTELSGLVGGASFTTAGATLTVGPDRAVVAMGDITSVQAAPIPTRPAVSSPAVVPFPPPPVGDTMLRSLFAGISGLRQHQTMMDITGNNIANINTTGFKSSTTVFQDTLSQMLRGAGAPVGEEGGTNPAQVGLGVRLSAITTNFAQGSAQSTGRSTDLMIQGDGFFVVRNGGENLYTRAGAFSFDTNGRLVSPEGASVQGWSANGGVVDTNAPVGDIVLPVGSVLAPVATTTVNFGGNLPSDAPVGTVVRSAIRTFDAAGTAIDLDVTATLGAGGVWSLASGAGTLSPATLSFTGSGATPSSTAISFTATGGQVIALDTSKVTGYAGQTSMAATAQNGSAMGTLQAFTMSQDGTLIGVFSNGLKSPLGQVALANFNNPPGLEKVGGSMYRTTVNSGTEQLGQAGTAGRGLLSSGSLEMSNVDLAAEFTNLIVAQRGFQANSRVITTSDQILEDLVNLKR
ncbi:MAG: flagellar hook-basal body complex protein [Sporichthyaceae bacterium]